MNQDPLTDLPPGLRSRWKVGPMVMGVVAVMIAVLLGSLFMPVCERIPKDMVKSFESVTSLEERAASGEPFEKKKNGHWYQCKSRLARFFFF